MIRIFIAGIPLPPNASRREHWSVRASDSKAFRHAAMVTAMTVARAARETLPYEVAAVRYDFVLAARRGDLDGLIAAAKPILDGLVDAGILRDDAVGKLDRLEAGWFRGPTRGVWVSVGRVDEELGRVIGPDQLS